MMTVETAEALILVTMDSVVHRQNCLWDAVRDLPCELLTEALAVLEADGEDVRDARQWFADHGVQLPAPGPKCTEVHSLPPVPYARRAPNQVSPETEALIRELLTQGQTKSAIARAVNVNRRVVIRVAREMVVEVESRRVHTGASEDHLLRTGGKQEAGTEDDSPECTGGEVYQSEPVLRDD